MELCIASKTIDSKQLDSLYERDLFSDENLMKYGLEENILGRITMLKKYGKGKLSKKDFEYIILGVLSVDQVKQILKISPQSEAKLKSEFENI